MPKTPSQDQDLDELPGFAPTEEPPAVGLPDEPADELQSGASSPPENQAPSTTSPTPSQPASEPERPKPPPPPTETSTEERETDLELLDGLAYLAGGLFELVGHFANRLVRVRRRGQETTLWLVSDEEAEAFAAPMARIAERRLPEELKSGDAKDLIIAGSVATEYATHNAAGIPGVAPQQVQMGAPPPPAETVPAPAAPPPPPAPPPPSVDQPHPPAEAPPLIGPDI